MDPQNPVRAQITAARQPIAISRDLLSKRQSFIFETTLAGVGPLNMIQDAKTLGYGINVVSIALDTVDLQIQRVRSRALSGEHDVPEMDIRRRYSRSLEQAPAALKQADEGQVFDNSGGVPLRVLSKELGRIAWRAAILPEWAARIEAKLKE